MSGIGLERRQSLAVRLLIADPDSIPEDVALMTFAERVAAPEFRSRCAGCHGADLQGDRGRGVPDLTTGQFLSGSGQVSELERTIAFGIRSGNPKTWKLADMPAYASAVPYAHHTIEPLRPGQIDDIVEYLFFRAGKPADPGAAARGRDLYSNDGACFDCHAGDASGDSAVGAPTLIGDRWLYGDGSRSALFDSVARGRHGVCPGWRGRPDPVGIRALAAYVYSIAHGKRPDGAGVDHGSSYR